MRILGYRSQRTLAAPVQIAGVGFITGAEVRVTLLPAAPDTGLVFRRIDRPGSPTIRAAVSSVTSTQRRTTLGPPDCGITLVEHILAALFGLRIDNCWIELHGPEPPGLDGSALGFVQAMCAVGAVRQAARRPIYTVREPVLVRSGGATLAVHPAAGLECVATYRLDYGWGAPLAPQTHTLRISPGEFARELAPCRTFLTESEVQALRQSGIGLHLGPADLLVFGAQGPIGNRVRFADEPARHKILDMIGDLALCGFDIAGHIIGYRSGHALNVELASRLVELAHGKLRRIPRRVESPRCHAA
ncbi:MAG: UDP-3-O-acyl-N-acetylglucosamine deacetylase [Gemmataceae bacterium]|nr:UDP-3-O-acyl-N-acetylglucosamine deacetylase [Gemmata sp.]MDW8197199.1 UDP-3-O-acyl-N-acetylglucosamine deacetylase [Gemmataceae bacterium]